MDGEKLVAVNGVELCVQEFGATKDPAILLAGGAAMSMDWWDDGFCEALASTGHRVVRFDARDTGRSTSWPAGKPGYRFTDLKADVVALIEQLRLAPVHLAGISMGGAMCQVIARERPGLLAKLTLIATTYVGETGEDLPGMDERLRQAPAQPDWEDREAYVDYSVAVHQLYAGPAGQDEARLRALSTRVFDRTRDLAASEGNHWVLVGRDDEGEDDAPKGQITVPTVVLHGTHDPMFPLPHGRALAAAVPGATLVVLEGAGHETPPPPLWDEAVAAMVR